jgi:hypothetical protein
MLDRVRSEKKTCAWSTADEIAWLRKLGETAKGNNFYRNYNVRSALRGYIEAAYKRLDWGLVDRDACIETARELLAGA